MDALEVDFVVEVGEDGIKSMNIIDFLLES